MKFAGSSDHQSTTWSGTRKWNIIVKMIMLAKLSCEVCGISFSNAFNFKPHHNQIKNNICPGFTKYLYLHDIFIRRDKSMIFNYPHAEERGESLHKLMNEFCKTILLDFLHATEVFSHEKGKYLSWFYQISLFAWYQIFIRRGKSMIFYFPSAEERWESLHELMNEFWKTILLDFLHATEVFSHEKGKCQIHVFPF